jgi:hypothetical protein
MYDGKGRVYEPGWYNATPTPPGTTSGPVAPTTFTNPPALPAPPPPERAEGMFYDDQFRRVHTGAGPEQDRKAARYRLRYTVGVEDLSGHLQINPIPDMQMIAQGGPGGPPVDYRTPATRNPWMTGATAAFGAICGAHTSGQFGAQSEHVFQGRGYQTNVDFDHTSAGLGGWPKTFPLMYRNHPNASGGSGCWGSWINGKGDGNLTDNLFFFSSGTPRGLAAGGEVIPNWRWDDSTNYWPYDSGCINHCLVGPQLSFDNATYAAHGERAYLGAQDGGGNIGLDKFGITPFGHRLTSTGFNPHSPNNKWYQGRVDTPFYFNLLTAPPGIINSVLIAYLPPREKVFKYTAINWYKFTGLDGNGNRQYVQVSDPPNQAPHSVGIDGTDGRNQGSAYGRDLLVDTTAPPSFAPWPAPDRSDSNPPGAQNPPGATGQYIKPDYYAKDVRDPLKTYPGPYMNGDSNIAGQGSDDLGQNMDQLNIGGGMDIHDRKPFVDLYAGWPYHMLSDFDGNPSNLANARGAFDNWASIGHPSAWGGSSYDYAQKVPDPHQVLHTYSYYFDMLNAFAVALSVFRADYVQYDNNWVQAQNLFAAGSAPSPQNCQTLRDFDKIFLAEMGESIDAPGSGWPAALGLKAYHVQYNGQSPVFTADYVPLNNIKSLVDHDLLHTSSLTSAQRGRVMELMLNDFRMSLLGCSPGYSDTTDPNLEFRPLDFDGDGIVHCSCYPDVDGDHLPLAPAGTKPPAYFTVTGAFFLGKSHYYRVFSRGEVWDNLLNVKVDDATLDSVLAVDPDGTDTTQTQFLYQRWFYNRYLGMLPHVQR